MNSKSKALHNYDGKKVEIKERIKELRHVPTERDKKIEKNNSPYNSSIRREIWRDRHNKRHGKGSAFNHSLESRKESTASMSKDYGSNIHRNRHMPKATL